MQAYGKIPFRISPFIDLYSVSAHKIGGIKSVGALIRKKTLAFHPYILGGGQESGRRSGTENVFGIKTFEYAAEKKFASLKAEYGRLTDLREKLYAALDPEMVREVLDVMLELADSGQTMLIVTHEMQFARAIADQVILLEDGGIVEQSDNAEQFFTNPTTERAKQFLRTFEFDRHRKSADQSE